MNDVKDEYKKRIKNVIESAKEKNIVNSAFKAIATKKIYIYGAGNAGAMTFKLLKDVKIEVEAFLDRRGGDNMHYYGKPVYKADDVSITNSVKNSSLVIIAFICGYKELNETQSWLKSLGYQNIFYYHHIYNLFVTNRLIKEENGGTGNNADMATYLNSVENKILRVSELFEDEESRSIYYNFLEAIFNANPDIFSLPSDQLQYFVEDIPFSKGYGRFIDCGAFDGDTALQLKECKGMAEAIALFEPDTDNFKKLCDNLTKNRVANEQVILPCGLWRETEMLRFRSGIQSSSGISEEGDTFIQCLALDDVLADFAPTFIKMDIEGAEFEALIGSKNMIKRYRPDLAISVYHSIEHMWEIPMLISSLGLGYKFYLRPHGVYGMETIMYASCEE